MSSQSRAALLVLAPIMDPEPNRLKNLRFWGDLGDRFGIDVTIHAPRPSYPDGRHYELAETDATLREFGGRVQLRHFASTKNVSGDRGPTRLVWALSQLLPVVARNTGSRPFAVYSYQGNPLNTVAAVALARRFRARAVVDLQDPWPLDLASMDATGAEPGGRWPARAASRFLRNATLVSPMTISDAAMAARITSVPNWSPDESPVEHTGPRGVTLTYTGSLGRAQGLAEWLPTVNALIAAGSLESFDIYGDGPEMGAVRQGAGPGVQVHGHVEPEDLGRRLSQRFGLVPLQSGLLGAGYAPQKIAYYLSRDITPVIAIRTPTAADLRRVPAGCHLVGASEESWTNVLSEQEAEVGGRRASYDDLYSRDAAIDRLGTLLLGLAQAQR